MKLLKFLRFSFELSILCGIGFYAAYYIFIGGKDISYYMRWNYTNGEIYLTSFHAFLAFIATLIFFAFLRGIISRYLKHTLISFTNAHKKQHAVITKFVLRFFFYLQYIGAAFISSFFIKENSTTQEILLNSRLVLGTFLFIFLLSGIVRIILEKKAHDLTKQKSSNASFVKFGDKVLFIIFWILGIGFLLSEFGYNLNALVAGAGIGGLAIALAAQKSLTNMFGAVTIILNKPFGIGDYVNINGQEGTIKDIGLSYVTLTDRLGHQVMMPNENIITSSIANFNVRENRRVDFIIGIVYSTSLEKTKEGVEIIKNLLTEYLKENKIADDIRVTFDTFNAYSLDIKVTYFSLEQTLADFNIQKQEINLRIKQLFSDAGIEMAFPTTEMIIKKGDI